MKIAIGSDHAGYPIKTLIMNSLPPLVPAAVVTFTDVGTHSEESCDYPDYAAAVAAAVRDGSADLGIAICGTGIGASIAANKVAGVRAALCTNEFMAEMARRHNNATVLVLGARVVGSDLALRIVQRFIESPFEGGRHQRRLDKIDAIERDNRTQ